MKHVKDPKSQFLYFAKYLCVKKYWNTLTLAVFIFDFALNCVYLKKIFAEPHINFICFKTSNKLVLIF